MAKRTVSDWKHGRYPFPVYVATFPDGETIRMSFWSREGKAFDFDRGRRLCEQVRMTQDRIAEWCGPYLNLPAELRSAYTDARRPTTTPFWAVMHPADYPVEPVEAIAGHVEIAGEFHGTDPQFLPATEKPRRKRVTVRELKDTLAAIIRLPELSRDQQVVQAARLIDQARELLAA